MKTREYHFSVEGGFHTYILILIHTYMKGAGEKRPGDSFKVEHLASAGLCPTYYTQWAMMESASQVVVKLQ